METSQFIDQLAQGQAADAKQTLTDLLSARAFEALEGRKQELAQSLFTGKEIDAHSGQEIETETEEEVSTQ
jgi:hypothetical protein